MALNWLPKTCYCVIETQARVSPDSDAVFLPQHDGSIVRLTFGELHGRVLRMAGRLSGVGVESGSRMAVWADNSIQWLEVWFAASLVGAVTVAINPRLTAREAGDLLAANAAGHLLIGGQTTERAATLAAEGRVPEGTFTLDDDAAFPALPAAEAPFEQASVDGRRVGLIQFTSGSTGLPKGAQLYEGSIATMGASCASRWLLRPSDRILGVFSLGHNAGTTYTTMSAFTAGAAMIYPPSGWAGGEALEPATRCGVTVIPGVDTIMADLLASDVRPETLRLVGGFDSIAAERIATGLGVEVSNTYGLTEVTANATVGDLRDPLQTRIDRIGKPHPGLEIRVVGEDGGEEFPPGEQGELQVRGWAAMKGYYGLPREEQPFTDDGWVKTGDLGSIDADGYVMFHGRLKDVIRSGGENVAAFEIERYLESHPDVLQAAVVAAPHPRYGEVPFAFVRVRPGADLRPDELVEFCRGQLAPFKIPKHVELVSKFPLVGINKVSKPELRARAAERVSHGG